MSEIIIALISGGFLAALTKGIFDVIRVRMNRNNAFHSTINDLNKIYEEMDELKSKTSCDRVLIITTKNGGGIPVPGSSLTASILFETYDKGQEAIKHSWQNRLIDEGYVKTLLRLEKEGLIFVDTNEMPDGILKDVHLSIGVNRSVMAKIKATEKRYFYLCCDFHGKMETADVVATKVQVLDAVEKIKAIL